MPKVSVIIPVYNVEKYLEQCLDSVINQTLKDIEIICVNDGSTDNSKNILEKYAQKDSRIKILTQENKGQGAARNRGIKEATGKYLYFVDSDDWLVNNALEKLFNHITKTNADICVCGLIFYDQTDNSYRPRKVYSISDFTNNEEDICTYKDFSKIIFTQVEVSLKMYDSEFFRKNNLFFAEGVFFEDVITHTKAMILAQRVTFLGEHLYYYRKAREGSTMSTAKNDLRVLHALIFIKETEKFLKENNLYKELEEEFLGFVLRAINYHYLRISRKYQKIFKKEYEIYFKDIQIKKAIKKFPKLEKYYKEKFYNPSILQQIFSITNIKTKKIVYLLGIKFEFRNKKLEQKARYEKLNKKLDKLNKQLDEISNQIIKQNFMV